MNHFFHRLTRLFVLPAALAGFSLARAAEQPDVAAGVDSPTKRQEAVDFATKLLAHREAPAVASDPFHPAGFDELVASIGRPAGSTTGTTPGETSPTQSRSGRDLLQAIGAGLKPSGFFVLSGQPTLLFGQKRVKAGGTVTITFEGNQYTLEITTIAPPNFTLRLNREEFTRTIK